MDEYTSSLLVTKSISSLRTDILSTMLADLLPPSIKTFKQLQEALLTIDFSNKTSLLTSDIKGLLYMSSIQSLILPNLTVPIAANSIDTSGFTSIKILSSSSGASNPFRGNMSAVTSLVTFKVTINVGERAGRWVIPNFAINPNLETIEINAGDQDVAYTNAEFGNVGGLRKLKSFTSTFTRTLIPRSVIDYALAQLRIAKDAGCPLTIVNMNGSKAPTVGASNADYLALVAAGVTVTLGTA